MMVNRNSDFDLDFDSDSGIDPDSGARPETELAVGVEEEGRLK